MAMNRGVTLLMFAAAVLLGLTCLGVYMLSVTSEAEDSQIRPIRVACVGDSLTRGTQYTLDLWHQLGADYIVGDFGVNGAAVYANSGRAYIDETAFIVAKDFQPHIVVIMLGTNDADATLNETRTQFISDYAVLVTQFQQLPTNPVVWLVAPPPIYQNDYDLCGSLLFEQIIPDIQQIANQTGCGLIDAHTPLVDLPELFLDGVHPNNEGAKLIADAIYVALSKSNR